MAVEKTKNDQNPSVSNLLLLFFFQVEKINLEKINFLTYEMSGTFYMSRHTMSRHMICPVTNSMCATFYVSRTNHM